jgi:hypothetical protein
VVQLLDFTTCLTGSKREPRDHRALSRVSIDSRIKTVPRLAQVGLLETNLTASYVSNRYCCNTIQCRAGPRSHSHFRLKFKN